MTNEHKEPWTPGPWTVTHGPNIEAGHVWVANVIRHAPGAQCVCNANARLIAEAPAMAALLERVVDWWTSPLLGDGKGGLLVKDIEALLSRARGEGSK